jgi:lipopolysaccharide transport system ATP-binding protein
MNAIAVHSLGKKFKLFTSPGGRFLEYMSIGKVKRHEDFWALKDISFDIPTGTTLGILGQNGSGKSTLLSILAGVLYPSAGSFEIKGKVSAILELGSGFHPEFSGRDNVYMYGSMRLSGSRSWGILSTSPSAPIPREWWSGWLFPLP